MKREIIKIDEEKCDGCGLCIPNCHEGALQLIDGKARLISDLFCDGLGACIGHCPQDAITLEVREAAPYDERLVMEGIVKQGENTILAHLNHLKEHNEHKYLSQALAFLEERNIDIPRFHPLPTVDPVHAGCGCSGTLTQDFRASAAGEKQLAKPEDYIPLASELKQWPVQLHLLNPMATYLQESDLLLASDCSAFTAGDFHHRFLKGKSLAIACPKLDQGKDVYVDKLATMIRDARLNTISVLVMEVPCCGGLMQLVNLAMQKAGTKIPVKKIMLSIRGEVLKEVWESMA